MPGSRRAQRRQERSAIRKAAAKAQIPEMLAAEESLRSDARKLSKRSAAMAQHASYDKQISAKCKRHTVISQRVQQHLRDLLNLTLSLRASKAGFLTVSVEAHATACLKARQVLQALESDHDELAELTAETAELMVLRAELDVVPVDREALAAGIETMARHQDALTDGVHSSHRDVSELCGEPCSC